MAEQEKPIPPLHINTAKPVSTIRMKKEGAGEIVVNEHDKDAYERQGYAPCPETTKQEGEAPCKDPKHDWSKYELKELREHAEAAKIEFKPSTKREDLIQLLCASGYVPPAK